MNNTQIDRAAAKALAEMIETYRDRALGWKLSGAGGGGYLIFVADAPVDSGFQVLARRGLE